MATRNDLVPVSDGDQLNEGYFNGILTAVGESLATQSEYYLYEASSIPSNLTRWTGDNFSDNSLIDTTNTTCLHNAKGLIVFCTVLDFTNDSSVDSSIWSTDGAGTASEDTERIRLSSYASNTTQSTTLISDGASGLDMKGQDGEVVFSYDYSHVDADTGGGSSSSFGEFLIQISNGTTHVTIRTVRTTGTNINASGSKKDVRIVINNTAETVDVWEEGVKVASAIDISSVTTNWYIRFVSNVDSASTADDITAIFDLYGIGYVKDGDSNSIDFVSQAFTAPITVSGVATMQTSSGESSLTTTVSANNGSNYSTCTDRTISIISNTGTQVKLKLSATVPSITNTQTNCTKLIGYGIQVFE